MKYKQKYNILFVFRVAVAVKVICLKGCCRCQHYLCIGLLLPWTLLVFVVAGSLNIICLQGCCHCERYLSSRLPLLWIISVFEFAATVNNSNHYGCCHYKYYMYLGLLLLWTLSVFEVAVGNLLFMANSKDIPGCNLFYSLPTILLHLSRMVSPRMGYLVA